MRRSPSTFFGLASALSFFLYFGAAAGRAQDPFEAYSAEFAQAGERAAAILESVATEQRAIRQDIINRMSGRPMSTKGPERWTASQLERHLDAFGAELQLRLDRVKKLSAHWDREYYAVSAHAPFSFETPGGPSILPLPATPGQRINAAALAERLRMVREELDELVVRSVAGLWHERLKLAGFSKDHWGEVDAIGVEVERKLEAMKWDWFGLEVVGPKRTAVEAKERAILEDAGLRRRLAAVSERLEPSRVASARKLIDWGKFVEETFNVGPQDYRQIQLERLRLRIDEILAEDLTTLRSSMSWYDVNRKGPFLKDPVQVEASRGRWQTKVLDLYVRPDLEGDLRAMSALEAKPTSIGHKELMDDGPPQRPHVTAVVVVRNVLSEDPTERLIDPNAAPAPQNEPGLTLCVFGHALNALEGERRAITSDSPDITYTRISEAPGVRSVTATHPLFGVYQDALFRATRDLPAWDVAIFGHYDAWIVNVRTKRGLMPGLKTIRIDETECVWLLPHATTRGSLSFIRERPTRSADEVDKPDEFFVLDRFLVEIETEHALEVDSLPIVLVHNGRPLQLRKSADESADGILTARKVPGHPTRLRTLPVFIESQNPVPDAQIRPNTHYAVFARGDTLLATTPTALFEAPTMDVVKILTTPDEVKTGDGKGMLFGEALVDAARIHDVQLSDVDLSKDSVVDTITHLIVFNWQRHKIELSLADHAAMLLMKRTFIHMAETQLAALESLRADAKLVREHVPVMTAMMQAGARAAAGGKSPELFPLGYRNRLPLPPDGLTSFGSRERARTRTVPLVFAFLEIEVDRFLGNPRVIERWRLDATNEALRLQAAEIKRAVKYARSVDDEDIEDLLELTGRGFGPVVDRILPRLVRLQSDFTEFTKEWVPNEGARDAVIRVGNTLAEHDTAGKAAREDTEALLAVLSAVGIGAGANVLGKTILVVGSGLGAGVALSDVITAVGNEDEVRFAGDAVLVIGRDRLQFGVQHKEVGLAPYLAMSMAFLGFRLDIGDVVKTVQASTARQIAEVWMPRVADEGAGAIAKMPLEDKTIVWLLMKEAEEAKAAGKTLTSAQALALKAARTIDKQIPVGHPHGWPYGDLRRTAATRDPGYADVTKPGRPPTAVGDAAGASAGANPSSIDIATRRYKDVREIPKGMPRPGFLVEVPGGGQKLIVGQPLGIGAYATTYELLDEFGAPTDKVIKFLRQQWDESSAVYEARMRKYMKDMDQDYNPHAMATHAPWDPTAPEDVVQRLFDGQKHLAAAKIPHLAMDGLDTPLGRLGLDPETPFVVQKAIDASQGQLLLTSGARLDEGMQVAVAKLYKQLADAGLVWKDGYIDNVFFQKMSDGQGGTTWIAGVLDPDMIVPWKESLESPFLRQKIHEVFAMGPGAGIGSIKRNDDLFLESAQGLPASADIIRRVTSGAHEFMAKMFEHKGWISFEVPEGAALTPGRPGQFEMRYLSPEVVKAHFGEIDQWITSR